MRTGRVQTLALALSFAVANAAADLSDWRAQPGPFPADPAAEARLDEIISRMSLHDKIGQIIMGEIQYVSPDDVRRYRLGAVLNGGGSFPGKNRHALAEDWLALADAYHDASVDRKDGRPAIPVIWGTDAVHGANNVFGATLFPHNIGLGAAANPELLKQIGAATAREVAATGIYWNFAPTLAVPDEIGLSDAFVVAWLPGSEGAGVADVLIADTEGKPRFDFSGRLSFSWPARPDQTTINYGDTPYHPAFPFRFGLRYPHPASSCGHGKRGL